MTANGRHPNQRTSCCGPAGNGPRRVVGDTSGCKLADMDQTSAAIDTHADEAAPADRSIPADELVEEELLIEEISIDGMCGVY
jgi:mycofactocin precursor